MPDLERGVHKCFVEVEDQALLADVSRVRLAQQSHTTAHRRYPLCAVRCEEKKKSDGEMGLRWWLGTRVTLKNGRAVAIEFPWSSSPN